MQTNIGTDAFTLQIKVIEARCVYCACQKNGKDGSQMERMLSYLTACWREISK